MAKLRLQVLSGGAAQGLMTSIAAEHGFELAGSFGAVGTMKDKLLAGEPADIVVLTAALIAQLGREGHVRAGSAVDLGGVRTGVAVRVADPRPDISGGDALRQALLAADEIYLPDPQRATAGIHFARVLDKLGIREAIGARLRTFPNGATAMGAMARATAARVIGCTQVTEILHTDGVALVAPLPAGFELVSVYSAAVASHAKDGDAARRFIALLSADAAQAQRTAAGFES
ncbi:MAG: substrate-binding domain-containing protein [Burkholderiaceae bacterium]